MYQRPFVTSRFTAYAGDSLRHRLSLAVLLIDEVTRQPPAGRFQVLLRELPGQDPIRNHSGFFCFLDIPDGNYTILVEPGAASRLYHLRPAGGGAGSSDLTQAVTLPLANPLVPVIELRLTPTPSYRFPGNATLVRGRVLNNGVPAVGVVVRCSYQQGAPTLADPDATATTIVDSRTDTRGHYVLFFSALSPAQQNVIVRAGLPPQTQATTIREGRVTPNVDLAFP